ncbi:MAG: choice-of-anchor Q domain-containing protein [bacterium]|nr:choice-of-anchor Q domain-containing protein [bacterium]
MRGILLLCTCITILATGQVSGATWHVAPPPLGNDSNPGTEGLPFATIQHGIDASSDGDTVTVAQGTYQENVKFKGKNIFLTGTNPLDPDVIAKTIIQRRQLGPTVTFSGTEKPSCSLSGFTVWDGKWGNGGAIRGNGTRATIGLNIITGGTADSYGGGLYGCDGPIYLNVITVNSSGLGGGGLAFCNGPIQFNVISFCWSDEGGALYECHGTIQNNTVTDCAASVYGAGLYDCDGDILNNTITKCCATLNGGGLHSCSGTLQNNTLTANSANGGALGGGGLCECNGTIQGNAITKNSASQGGGLSYCHGLIQNNVIAGNVAGGGLVSQGGGLAWCFALIRNNLIASNQVQQSGCPGGGLSACFGTIENNTITGNRVGGDGWGGGVSRCGTIRNCVIWGNSASQEAQVDRQSEVPTYCCIQDWWEGGEGNIALNPRLCDPDGPDDDFFTLEDNDCHLDWDSPCIDAGKNEPWMWGGIDLDGNNRVFLGGKSATVDMGAYEYGSFRFTVVNVERTSSNQLKLTWTSRPGDTYVLTSSGILNRPDWFQEGTVPSQGATTSFSVNMGIGSRNFYRIEMAH